MIAQTEKAPGAREYLDMAAHAIDQAQNKAEAAATLLRQEAHFGAVDADEKRAKEVRIQDLISRLEEFSEAFRELRGW